MTDLFAATDSGILVPTKLRTQVIPWETLKALNPPQDQPQVSTDMLSAFAVLVAQGPRAPALVGTDEHSALLVNAEINQHTTVGRPQAIGDHVLMVSDPTYGGAGDVFLVIPASGAAAHGPYQVSGAGQDSDGTIHLLFGLQANVAVGDGVRRLPLIGISSALNTIQLTNSSANPVSVLPVKTSLPYDVVGTLAGSGTITNPFSSLLTLVAYTVHAFQFGAPGAAWSGHVTFTDAIGGQLVWETGFGVPAVGGQAFIDSVTGLAAPLTGAGDGLTVTVSPAPGANQGIQITVGLSAR